MSDAPAKPERHIASPCISVCKLDPFADHCTGCFRSLDEIAKWRDLPQDAREKIMSQLPERRAKATPSRRR